ncbi:hypothetical protein BASA61_008192 [Batrachochytrium salamandrivorans]|nr:hypothetical protein BASA61_008192 [Batrachochytrium salamandrivorans]
MKLISFAVISLLAVTVSAQILPSTSATDDALQCDQNPVQEKIQELTISYQLQEELALELEGFEELKKEELETKLIMDGLKNGFKRKGLSKAGKLDLERQYAAAVEDWKQAEGAVMDRKNDLIRAEEKRNGIKIKLLILKNNIERQMKEDAKDQSQTKASPGSSHPKKILERQIDEACTNADELSAADKDSMYGIYTLGDMIWRKKDSKKLELHETWENFVGSCNKIMREVEFMQKYCTYAKELQMNFGWQPPSSGGWGDF